MKVGIPKDEITWTFYIEKGVTKGVITSKESRDMYFAYSLSEDGTYKKIGKGKSPTDLERKYYDKLFGRE